MEKLSKRKSAVLEILDEQIDALETRLAKVQPLIDELASLKKTRATLLNERTTTGGVGNRTQLTMETMIQWFRDHDNEPAEPPEIAKDLGVTPEIVRSHLNRHRDTRYERNGDGWLLIGEDDDEE